MTKIDVLPLLTPQMRAALEQSQALYAAMDDLPADRLAAMRESYRRERRFWNAVPVELASVETVPLALSGLPPFRVRFYRPASAGAGALVYLHGGGFVVGDLDTHDRIMRLMARRAGVTVVGVDYALSPEAHFPVALNQVLATVRHLAESGPALGIDPDRLAVGGDSAGANLALGTALSLAPVEPGRIKVLLLFYGAFGLQDSASQRLYGNAFDGLTRDDLRYYRDSYLGTAADIDDPRYNGLAGDLAGLPPALIVAAALDPLLDDSLALARMLGTLGINHELRVYDGLLHGFLHLSRTLDAAYEAIDCGARWLNQAISRPETPAPRSPAKGPIGPGAE
jgi:acetyl esterase